MATVYEGERLGRYVYTLINDKHNFGAIFLVKTHCNHMGLSPYSENTYSIQQCLCAQGRVCATAVAMDRAIGILRVIRNPIDSLVARLHFGVKRGHLPNYAEDDFNLYFPRLVKDIRVHMRWHKSGNARNVQLPTEVLAYEDLLIDPQRYASDVARILGIRNT